jgi:hypothetical protein
LVSEIHQSKIHWLLDQLKRDLCRTKTVNVFEQVVVADLFCLATQKSQPTPYAVVKYLLTGHYIIHYLMLIGKFVSPVFRGWQLAVVERDQMFPVLIGNLSSLTSMHAK